MSGARVRLQPAPSRGRALAIAAPLLGAFLLASCQAAEDDGATESPADEPTQAAESVVAASPSPEAPEDEPTSEEVTLTVSETSAGPALAGEDGMTLYVLFGDSEDGSGCVDACEDAWPPFTIEEGAEVVAGEGVTGEFPTTTRPDGTTQVTWFGRPLYYYADDSDPGDANGHEVGDVWFVVEQ
jgi:predicted lipoprotein with Yx(FWY)xxD motif